MTVSHDTVTPLSKSIVPAYKRVSCVADCPPGGSHRLFSSAGQSGARVWEQGSPQPSIEDWLAWLGRSRFKPTSFLTLTFDNRRADVSHDLAFGLFKKLVHCLNVDAGGQHYRRKFKHSYFSYIVTTEYQKRGVLHLHALVDGWIDFSAVHRLWNSWAGFAWISKVPNPKYANVIQRMHVSSEEMATRYVLKYVLKDGLPVVWLKESKIEVRRVTL